MDRGSVPSILLTTIGQLLRITCSVERSFQLCGAGVGHLGPNYARSAGRKRALNAETNGGTNNFSNSAARMILFMSQGTATLPPDRLQRRGLLTHHRPSGAREGSQPPVLASKTPMNSEGDLVASFVRVVSYPKYVRTNSS